MRYLPIWLLLVFLCAEGMTPLARGQESPIDRVLPDTTRVYLRFDSVDATRHVWDDSSLGKLWLDPEMEAFRTENGKTVSRVTRYFEESYGLTPEFVLKVADREMVVAGIETPAHDLSFVYFVRILPDEADGVQRFIQDAIKVLESHGATRREVNFAIPATLFNLPKVGEQVVFAAHGEYVMIAGDEATASAICRVWAGEKQRSLADREEFQRIMKFAAGKREGDVIWFLDPIHLAAALETEQARRAREEAKQDVPFPLRHGFTGIRGMGGRFTFGEDPFDLSGEILIDAPKPFHEALRMLDLRAGPLDLPKTIPANVSSCAVAHWQLASVIKYFGPVFDDIVDAPSAYERTLRDTKETLGVDLEQEIFGLLSTQITSQSFYQADKKTERTVTKVAIKEPERGEPILAEMVLNLFSGDTSARRVRLPGRKHDLWKIRFKVGNENTPFSATGLTVADGHLWLSSHASLLEELLSRPDPKTLYECDDFQCHLKTWEELLTQPGFLHGFIRSADDFEHTYNAIREGGIDGLGDVDSFYAYVLAKILGNPDSAAPMDYATLPEFSKVRRYFGLLGYVGTETENGWLIRFGSQVPESP